MKINYIKLSNIGPYVGEHIFNLNTSSVNNIILIGGKNGAGKTTFLKSIKYGLFGSFAMGLKTDTLNYFKEIATILNNRASKDFFIEIEFEFVENYELKRYTIKRIWYKNLDEISEKINILVDDVKLDENESKEVIDKLKAITSPHLINSFIFDGEKISHCIENGEVNEYLKETFNSIFNVDLIAQTEKDLMFYISKKSQENNSKSQIQTVSLLNKINSLKNQLKIAETDRNNAVQSKNSLLTLKKANNESFYSMGGLTKKQQQLMMDKMAELTKARDEMNKDVRNFIETDMPLFLNLDMLQDAQLQLATENRMHYHKILVDIEDVLGKDLSDLKKELVEKLGKCNLIHECSTDTLEKVGNKIMDISCGAESASMSLKKKGSNVDEYKIMYNQILKNENTESLKNIIDELKKIDESLIMVSSQIDEYESKIKSLTDELNTTYQVYEKINDEIKKSNIYDNSFAVAQKCYEVCEKFTKKLTEHKLNEVSKLALQIFNDTIRKNDFISKLKIDNEFNLELYNTINTKVDPKILSAGEMQILISSLIWAMFRISGRREMFIFDTPLARLDTNNRYNFIEKIISTISHQVVILSTDSEFVGENLAIIEKNIHKKYLLEYDESNFSTTVTENYFGGAM